MNCTKTHEITTKDNVPAIKCLICDLVSCNTNDIKYKYCVFCDVFHDYPDQIKNELIIKNKDKLWKLQQLREKRSRTYTKTFLKKQCFLTKITTYTTLRLKRLF